MQKAYNKCMSEADERIRAYEKERERMQNDFRKGWNSAGIEIEKKRKAQEIIDNEKKERDRQDAVQKKNMIDGIKNNPSSLFTSDQDESSKWLQK